MLKIPDSLDERVLLTRPDDFHLHLREGAVLRAVLPYSARLFARAVVMPNLAKPILTAKQAENYREQILAALSPQHRGFQPLMTLYLTEETSLHDFSSLVFGAKLYMKAATTNSHFGIEGSRIERLYPLFEGMEKQNFRLLIHGELARSDIDVFDREQAFIEQILAPLVARFPSLRITLEHITTSTAADFVEERLGLVSATITPHHLLLNRSDMFAGGLRAHLYCLPLAKREHHRRALVASAASGDERFFLGTDSAPHLRRDKECACACAGIFNAPYALEAVLAAFEHAGKLRNESDLRKLEGFTSLNGALFHGLPVNEDQIELARSVKGSRLAAESIATMSGESIMVFTPESCPWRVMYESGDNSGDNSRKDLALSQKLCRQRP